MTKKLPPDQLKNKPRTKEALLERADKFNVDVPDKLYTLNELARTKTKIMKTSKAVNPDETRGGARNNTLLSSNISDDMNAQLLEHVFKYWNLPTAKTDDEIAQRVEFYFNDCYRHKLKPTLEGVALAIGITTQTFNNWSEKESKSDFDRFAITKRVKQVLANFDASLLINGKMNPVAYIFRSKNLYGMKDQTETVIKKDSELGDKKTPDELLEIIDANVVETD